MCRFWMLNDVPGLASMTCSGICWWYFEIDGSSCWLPCRTLCAAASVPFFLVMPRVIASMSTSASL